MLHLITMRPLRLLCLAGCALLLWSAGPVWAQPKKTRAYPFTAPPLEILDRLAELNMGPAPKLTAEERMLLTRIWTLRQQEPRAKIDEATLVEAMLFASGVEDGAARRTFAAQYARLAARAKDAVKSRRTPYDRGNALVAFLHQGVLAKGYREEQTLWHSVFTTGQYNCVSATAMVYLVGTHIGLEFKPLSIRGSGWSAGHATLDMRDGNRWIQVEATNRDGFDWEKKVQRPGVITLGLVPDRKAAYAVDGLGLAAMIYSNRGVAATKAKVRNPLLAARLYLAGLALDPTDPTVAHNGTGLFVNWGRDLAKAKQFEESIRVSAFGLRIAPKESDLRTNHAFAWSGFIRSLLDAGKDQEAIRVVARAAKAMPADSDFQSAAAWFQRHGEDRLRKDGWPAALAVIDRGVRALPAAEAQKLLAWRTSVLRRWSQSLLDKKDSAGSLAVLARAHPLDPTDRAIRDGIGYHVLQALDQLARAKGLPAAIEHYEEVCRRFPDAASAASAASAAWSFAVRRIDALAREKKYAQAVAAAAELEPLVGSKVPELGGRAYDLWARTFMAARNWEQAIRVYQEGLQAYPNQGLLQNNLDYCKGKLASRN